jgi:uncharacterized protein (TIGR03086 family)
MTTVHDPIHLLERAGRQFAEVVDRVTPDALDAPSPCEGWTVRDLLAHVAGGERLAAALLAGASREEGLAAFEGVDLGADPATAFVREHAASLRAFREPGALGRICAHPMGDIPAAMLLGFRITDLTLHAWDLARATGTDETLEPLLVESVWATVSRMAEGLAASGVFGAGPSGTVADDAPLQQRLLDCTGRRP